MIMYRELVNRKFSHFMSTESTLNAVEPGALPQWAYAALAILCAAIGLSSSIVTAKFFILGLRRLEGDPVARDVLVATGMLMIATELLAFGLVSLLPINRLRTMRTTLLLCGGLLLAFEATTIYVTQASLFQGGELEASAREQRIEELQTAIASRRADAKSLRENGIAQGQSKSSWVRSLGANALHDALEVERQIEPLSAELVDLQRNARPTMSSILGKNGMLYFGIARGLLISTMGLVMFSAAGALAREAMHRSERSLTSAQMQPGPAPRQSHVQRIEVPKFYYIRENFEPSNTPLTPVAAAIAQLHPPSWQVQEHLQGTSLPFPASASSTGRAVQLRC